MSRKKIQAVVTGSDYVGTGLQTFASVKSAQMLRESFVTRLFPDVEMVQLYNTSKWSFVEAVKSLAFTMKSEPTVGITVYCGHGNNTPDTSSEEEDGMDELYQFPDGVLIDDEFTSFFNGMHEESILIALSDCCSSGTDLDTVVKGENGNEPFLGRWITFGACTDREDDMQSGDGGVLAETITSMDKDVLLNTRIRELGGLLEEQVSESWVGNLQHLTVRASTDMLMDKTLQGLISE
jgi:hypothetical protein